MTLCFCRFFGLPEYIQLKETGSQELVSNITNMTAVMENVMCL